MAGILVGWWYSFSIPYILGGAIFCLLIAGYLLLIGWERMKDALLPVLIFLLFLLGILRISIDRASPEEVFLKEVVAVASPGFVWGRIIEPPREHDEGLRFLVKADSVAVGERRFIFPTTISATYHGEAPTDDFTAQLGYDRQVELYGLIKQPGSAGNPGQFDLKNYLELQGVYVQLVLYDTSDIVLANTGTNWFLRDMVYPLRRWIASMLDVAIGGDESRFLLGLTIGDRSGIPLEVKDAFVNSGVMHILAVSGLHVGLLVVILLTVVSLVRPAPAIRTLVLSALLVFYVFLTGSPPSVVRAVIMTIVILGAGIFQRKPDVVNSLGVAAMAILLYDGRELLSPGFQLSFAAVLSILLLYPRFNRIALKLPVRIQSTPIVKGVIGLASVSLAAAIGTLPFTSFYFAKVSIIGLAANLVVVPLTGVVLAFSVTTLAISAVSSLVGSLFAGVAQACAGLLLWFVKLFGLLPFAYIDYQCTPGQALTYYAVLGTVINLKRIPMKYFLITGLLVANIFVYARVFYDHESIDRVHVTLLDVGQGDAILIEFPEGKRMLIDAGPRTFNVDAGARTIVPYLKRNGIRRLDALVVTHPHSDHLGGVPSLLRSIDVDTIYDAGSHAASELFMEYRHLVDSIKSPQVTATAGRRIGNFDRARVYALHPSGAFLPADTIGKANLNNQSVVLKIVFGKTSILLVGDAEEDAEEVMIEQYGEFLKSDILKTGHHGSSTSSSEAFIDRVTPTVAFVSAGRNNKFHHPSPKVTGRFEERGVRVYRTDLSNAVKFVSDGNKWEEERWR